MRTIRKACKACGAPVPFHVWPGFRDVARFLASRCPACHCVSVLEGPDSWHKSRASEVALPLGDSTPGEARALPVEKSLG